MPAEIGRIAMVTMHTSPAARPGTGDAGGMNVVVMALARELAGRGIEVDLMTRAEADSEPVELGHRLRLIPVEAGPRGPLPKSELAVVADEFGEAVADMARKRQYDVIHAHYWLSGLATLPVAIELGVPFVQSFHTLAAMKNRRLALDDSPESEQRMRAEAFIAGEADAVIAGSAAEVHSLIDQVNAPAEALWVIPPGVDARLFTPKLAAAAPAVRRWLDIDGGRPIVAVVGRIQPHKGQDLALHVLAELRDQFGSAPALVIAGEATPGDDDYLHRLRELAVELEVAREVRFVGALDRIELAELLAAASVTLVPSHTETFGLVALESAACGTPVIGSRSTGLADAIADGRSGMLMASRNPAEWARAVASLLDDTDRLATLSRGARAHAESYSWESAAAALLRVYESL